jgi:membrane protein implicated in regulation of membrane protease activity
VDIVWTTDTFIFAAVAILAVLILLLTFIVDGILDIWDIGVDDFNIQTIAAFFAGFGATGWLLSAYFGVPPLLSALSGLGGGLVLALIVVLTVRRLQSASNSAGFSIQEVVGQEGVVTLRIPPTGIGQIQYRMSGAVHTASARSQDNQEIPIGRRVRVLGIVGGELLVAKIER